MSSVHILAFCALALLLAASPACAVALNLPAPSDADSSASELLLDDAAAGQPHEAAAEPEGANCTTKNKTSTVSNDTEQRQVMMNSIRQQILAKLNMREPPPTTGASAGELPQSVLSSYYAHLQSMEQNAEPQQECHGGESTYFSRHLSLYHPADFASYNPPADHFQVVDSSDIGEDGKEEDKEEKKASSGKKGGANSSPNTAGKSPSISPVLYNLRFDDLEDLAEYNRVYSVKLQLYKRKAPSTPLHEGRGVNPVENVKVYRVLRTYSNGRSVKSHVLLASKNVASEEDDGLVTFNITAGVKSWLDTTPHETSLELDVHIETPEKVDIDRLFPPTIKFDIPSQGKEQQDARLLVEKLNEKEKMPRPDHMKRRKREVTLEDLCRTNPNETCCKRDLTVNFHEDLGLDFIRYPPSFTSNYCKGGCKNPHLPSATKSTEFLMTLRQSNPTAAAEPCCVPHRTRPLLVVMFLNNQIELEELPDMIVDSCICR